MADSNITKRAMAGALKELMTEKSFSKISVADICEKCGMNRKSFYYHFHDKYDLVNWIFDTDFASLTQKQDSDDSWKLLESLCIYFYENRSFYRIALKVEGQNSFRDHFRELLYTLIHSRLADMASITDAGEFQVNFFSDATVMTLQRWLLDPDCLKPDEFMVQIKICIQCMADRYSTISTQSPEMSD